MNVIQKEPQCCLWRWRWRREREEQVKINSVLVSMHISPDLELKYLLQKEEFSGWKITSVEPFNDGNKGSEWSWHKKRARKRAQYFLWPRLSQLSTVIIKNPKLDWHEKMNVYEMGSFTIMIIVSLGKRRVCHNIFWNL